MTTPHEFCWPDVLRAANGDIGVVGLGVDDERNPATCQQERSNPVARSSAPNIPCGKDTAANVDGCQGNRGDMYRQGDVGCVDESDGHRSADEVVHDAEADLLEVAQVTDTGHGEGRQATAG